MQRETSRPRTLTKMALAKFQCPRPNFSSLSSLPPSIASNNKNKKKISFLFLASQREPARAHAHAPAYFSVHRKITGSTAARSVRLLTVCACTYACLSFSLFNDARSAARAHFLSLSLFLAPNIITQPHMHAYTYIYVHTDTHTHARDARSGSRITFPREIGEAFLASAAACVRRGMRARTRTRDYINLYRFSRQPY